jgi:hypothetical protein
MKEQNIKEETERSSTLGENTCRKGTAEGTMRK